MLWIQDSCTVYPSISSIFHKAGDWKKENYIITDLDEKGKEEENMIAYKECDKVHRPEVNFGIKYKDQKK